MKLNYWIREILEDLMGVAVGSVTFDLYLDEDGCVPKRPKDGIQHVTFTIEIVPKPAVTPYAVGWGSVSDVRPKALLKASKATPAEAENE